MAPSEYKAVEDLRAKGIQVEVLPSRKTVYFENIYGENQDDRKQRVLAKADPFTVEELKDEEAKFFHLGSLLSDDFSLDVVKLLSGKGKLAVDAQGYLREVRGEQVYPTDWKDKRDALKYIDILKVNEHEAEVLTGFKDFKQAALQLAEWGVKEVLLTLGSLGSIIYAEGTFYKIPAYPAKNVVDATGCGDTYYRVGQGHYCPLPPSEPYVRVSPHTAQAFQSLCSCAETGSSYFLFPLFLRDNLKHSS